MEENRLIKADDISLLPGEIREYIDPDIGRNRSRRKINLYLILTVSAFVLFAVLSIFEVCISLSGFKYEVLSGDISTGAVEKHPEVSLFLPEYLIGRSLGLDFDNSYCFLKDDAVDSDEQEKNILTGTDLLFPSETEGLSDIDDPIRDGSEGDGNTSSDIFVKEDSPEENGKRYPIASMDLSRSPTDKYYIGNETGYNPDVKALLESDTNSVIPAFSGNKIEEGPLVLIIHTHGTEAYTEEGKEYYIDDGGELWRSRDTNKNVVAVGRVIAEILEEEGVSTIHCETMHDEESYQDSYSRAADTIRTYISKYPSIKYVFDIHRDAILKSDGTLVSTVTEFEGERVAQVMTVVGSNYKGADFPDWEKHLALALHLKKNIDQKSPTISRPVYLRGAAYNQQYTPGSLLIEIGTGGNTLGEAKAAARIVAHSLADIINGK